MIDHAPRTGPADRRIRDRRTPPPAHLAPFTLAGRRYGIRRTDKIDGDRRRFPARFTNTECDPDDDGATLAAIRAVNTDDPAEELYAALALLRPGQSHAADLGAGGIIVWTRVT